MALNGFKIGQPTTPVKPSVLPTSTALKGFSVGTQPDVKRVQSALSMLDKRGIADKLGKDAKTVGKAGGEFAKDVARGTLGFFESGGEAIGQLLTYKKNKGLKTLPPAPLPGLEFLGPIESIQSKHVRKLEEGKTPTQATIGSVGDIALNEPLGVAIKPLAIAGSFVLKEAAPKIIDAASKLIAKSKNIQTIIKNLKRIGQAEEPAYAGIAEQLKNVKDPEEVKQILNKSIAEPGGTGEIPKVPETPQAIKEDLNVIKNEVEVKSPDTFDADKYVKEQTAKREAARALEQKGFKQKAKDFLAVAKAKIVDFSSPIEDVLDDAVKKNNIKLPRKDDIRYQIDRVLRSKSIAGDFAQRNGIVNVIKMVDDLPAFDQYLTAKHAIDLNAKGIETGRELLKDQALVKALEGKYEPFAQSIRQYSQNLLDYTAEAGLISPELAASLKQEYPNYVPFNRVFSEIEKNEGYGTKAVASLSKQNIVQKLKGSTREIESPIESLLAKTNDAFRQGEKNIAGRLLASYENLPDNPFGLRELEEGEKALHTISFLDNGVKRTFETTKEIAEAAKALDVEQLNIIGKIFALPVRIARIGITGINIPFVASNLVKDQVFSTVISDNALATSLANPENFLKSLMSAVKHDDLYNELVQAGGGGTSFDLARDQASLTVKKIRAGRSATSKAKFLVKNPMELLRAIEDIIARSEELTRVQQYRGTKMALLKKGESLEEATLGAAKAARQNTVNFARHGEWGKVLNSMFLYLNAGVQGSRTLVRALRNNPIRTSAKIAATVFLPVATATAWNISSPARKEAYRDIAEYEKENNLIILPPNPKKDKNGKWNIIKIPLPPGLSNLSGLVRRPIEVSANISPVKFRDFSNTLLGAVSPIGLDGRSALSTLTPQLIKPSIESVTNQNLFTGFPIVPESMRNLPPEKQVKDGTSATAIKIANLLHISPLKAEAFIKGTFGGVGSQALNAVDNAMALTGIIPKDEVGGQSILDSIGARFGKATGGEIEQSEIDRIQKIRTEREGKKFDLEKQAEKQWAEWKTIPQDEARVQYAQLQETNPELAEKIKEVATDEKKGLTTTEKFIKQLQVTNGERATYLADKFNELKTVEEKKALWAEYREKGIISDTVAEQLTKLLKKQ